MRFAFIFPLIGALLGSLVFIFTMAMALAVIPYVLARAMAGLADDPLEKQARRSAELLQKIADKN